MEIEIKGYSVQIDDEFRPLVECNNWRPNVKKYNKEGVMYFMTRIPKLHGRKTVYLHRHVAGCVPGDGRIVDHINGDTFNCTKTNLRLSDPAKNAWNRKKMSTNTSGYRGVCFEKKYNLWRSYVSQKSRRIHLGYFKTPEEASCAYEDFITKSRGEHSRVLMAADEQIRTPGKPLTRRTGLMLKAPAGS